MNTSDLSDLLEDGFRKCVFDNIKPPSGLLKRTWLAPGGCYQGHWIWDSMFVADLLSSQPGHRETIRDAFRVYWDFQDSWNAATPSYAHWMVANNVKPNGATPFTQSECIIAWAMERIFRRGGDRQIVEEGLERLERYHDLYWTERDLGQTGLITVGTYAPLIKESPFNASKESLLQSARYESFDFQPPLDNLDLTPHPRRGGPTMYGDICLPDATAFLIQAEQALCRMAELTGRSELAQRRLPRIEKAVAAMRRHMWDEEAGMFLAVKRDSLEKIPVPSICGFIPLFAQVPTTAQAARMAEKLQEPDWATPLPLPSVGRDSPRFDDDWGREVGKCGIMWRGDVWNPVNYLICSGLAAYGFNALATKIADATVENALRHGFNERYHPDNGHPLGVQNLGMSCTALTMLLDGLASKPLT